ncbi:MAG TPA: glycoside hydrolase family 28 protein [Chitinophagaceae bacterium]|nr:glycoside hydrolase family 28 protein [Chitinophagaceae bacterium]
MKDQKLQGSATGLGYGLIIFIFLFMAQGFQPVSSQSASAGGWDRVPALLKKIVPPRFARRDFSILNYGAKPDSTMDCLPAIKRAIAACHMAGGGRVLIPAGTHFVKGPIHLKSNVNLHLARGAVLQFSTDADDYLPVVLTRFEGMELMNYSPLIYAYGQHNIAVTGQGILDGQADNAHWWNWTGSKRFGWKQGMGAQHDPENEPALTKMAARGVPVEKRIFGKGHYMRPTFLEFYHCKNILIRGITIKNTPFWVLHPTLSQSITIDSVTTISYGPNNDGCDPESCQDVLIKNCFFSNGDDCIAIKSGRNEDGRRINVPSKNIIIENCKMKDGHGGVVIGSETSGGVENIYARDCQMNSPHLDRAIRIKSNACRGGVLKNFYFRNIEVGQVHEAVFKINMFYGSEADADCHYPPTLDSVFIDHVVSRKSEYAIYIKGRKDKPVSNITITRCSFGGVEKENIIQDAQHVKVTNTTINGKPINID